MIATIRKQRMCTEGYGEKRKKVTHNNKTMSNHAWALGSSGMLRGLLLLISAALHRLGLIVGWPEHQGEDKIPKSEEG